METIRDRITNYQNEILKGNLMPPRAAEMLTELSALIGNLNDRITETDMAYNQKLLECYNTQETVNRAKIIANTSQEYKDMRDARNTKELAIEIIRSLKYLLKSRQDEWQVSGNQ